MSADGRHSDDQLFIPVYGMYMCMGLELKVLRVIMITFLIFAQDTAT